MSNRPTHHLSLVTEHATKDGEVKRRFHEIAPLWRTEKGNISGQIPDGMTLSGRILITTAKGSSASESDDTAEAADNGASYEGLSDS